MFIRMQRRFNAALRTLYPRGGDYAHGPMTEVAGAPHCSCMAPLMWPTLATVGHVQNGERWPRRSVMRPVPMMQVSICGRMEEVCTVYGLNLLQWASCGD